MTLLAQIYHIGRMKDRSVPGAAEALRYLIEKLKRRNPFTLQVENYAGISLASPDA